MRVFWTCFSLFPFAGMHSFTKPVILFNQLKLKLNLVQILALLNPILPGWNPDPSIIRVGSDYFIVTSSFEHFPGHPIYHSKDLVDWTLIGHALNRPSQLSLLGTPPDAGELNLIPREAAFNC